MSEESTLPQGGSEALPETNTPAPRNDAEAALQQSAAAPVEDAAQKAEREEADRKKNRTKEYIERINREKREMAEEIARLKAPSNTPAQGSGSGAASEKEPTLEDFDWDMGAFNKAHAKWAVSEALKEQSESSKKADEGRKQREITDKYLERMSAFAEDHEDFVETVGSIKYPLHDALQAAIMAHERGPEIAYHLGNNDDDAFALASIQPHLAAAAVERLAKRLTAAPAAKPDEGNARLAPQSEPTKPITKAPAPARTLSGRTPTDTPPEKLTDDEWYRRDQERRRKR